MTNAKGTTLSIGVSIRSYFVHADLSTNTVHPPGESQHHKQDSSEEAFLQQVLAMHN